MHAESNDSGYCAFVHLHLFVHGLSLFSLASSLHVLCLESEKYEIYIKSSLIVVNFLN